MHKAERHLAASRRARESSAIYDYARRLAGADDCRDASMIIAFVAPMHTFLLRFRQHRYALYDFAEHSDSAFDARYFRGHV